MSLNFALIGAGGYIAPRHLKAIKETGNNLVAAVDKNDSVGILDSHFPEVEFFTDFEAFEKFACKLKRSNPEKAINYVSICTPNYLHEDHIISALRLGANVICEKPLVLNTESLDNLQATEMELGMGKVNTVLQLRLHPVLQQLKDRINNETRDHPYDIDLTYITPRGKWYYISWKGDSKKSGGVMMNIGIHFFDMLTWIFGGVKSQATYCLNDTKASGHLELEKARVRWYLSLDRNDLPETYRQNNKAYRSITIDGEELSFTDGFTDLHTEIYKKAIAGDGFGMEYARPSIELVEMIRNSSIAPINSKLAHPIILGNHFSSQKQEIPAAVPIDAKVEEK